MGEAADPSAGKTRDEILAAVDAETRRRVAEATMPDGALTLDPAEVRSMAVDFRRVRDIHRGRFAAPMSELPGDPVRVATALGISGEGATPEERRHWLEDLVDLQAFVEDSAAGNTALSAIRPPQANAATEPLVEELLERIRWRQSASIAALMGHPSVTGDHNAIRGRWTAIGDARAAIDLVNDYRETQVGGFGALSIYPVVALVGFGVTVVTGNARPSLAGLAVLGVGWLATPYVGGAFGAFEARILRSSLRTSRLASVLEVVVGFGALVGVPFIYAIVVAMAATKLGLP